MTMPDVQDWKKVNKEEFGIAIRKYAFSGKYYEEYMPPVTMYCDVEYKPFAMVSHFVAPEENMYHVKGEYA